MPVWRCCGGWPAACRGCWPPIRLLVHDRDRVAADLACAIADGAQVISGFRVIGDQAELLGPTAAAPTVWRTLDEIATGDDRALQRITAAVNAARRTAWVHVTTRRAGRQPGQTLAAGQAR
jgi:hypothetical protein